MTKHVNIPIFIPHLGCPNQCVFCNQRSISGLMSLREIQEIDKKIDTILSTVGECKCEIAFFGGSFTGIDRKLMIELLDKAQSYVKEKKVSGIRMSTRPDYINEEIINILNQYTISAVELGIQSMNNKVLEITKRGHNVRNSENAVRLLKQHGYYVVGQMMIGLPGAEPADEEECAMRICDMGADASRIYPTVIFRDTELACMYEKGEYQVLTLNEAVERSKNALKIFVNRHVNCIRIGLYNSENLHSNETYVAGVNHEALGELIKSALYYDIIDEKIQKHINEKNDIKGKEIIIFCAKGMTSQICGQNRENKLRIQNKYSVKNIKILEKDDVLLYNIVLNIL